MPSNMTPEQAERYFRLLKYEAKYWDSGDGFGGRYYRDYEKKPLCRACSTNSVARFLRKSVSF